jgi:hypothetical protein
LARCCRRCCRSHGSCAAGYPRSSAAHSFLSVRTAVSAIGFCAPPLRALCARRSFATAVRAAIRSRRHPRRHHPRRHHFLEPSLPEPSLPEGWPRSFCLVGLLDRRAVLDAPLTTQPLTGQPTHTSTPSPPPPLTQSSRDVTARRVRIVLLLRGDTQQSGVRPPNARCAVTAAFGLHSLSPSI